MIKIMYQVNFTQQSHSAIHNFIIHYKNIFLDLFTNTGLTTEDIIRKEYIKKSNQFKDNIYNGIDKVLSQDKVLGFSKLENGNLEITTIVGNYRLFIEFFEEKENKLRFVENIRFFNK